MEEHRIDPADEGRHQPGDERFWNESYYFDFHRDDGSLGGYIRLGLYPNLGVTWYWACLVGADRPLVTAIDHGAPLPDAPSLDILCDGIQARHRCKDPTRLFQIALEVDAVALDDPAETYGAMMG